MLKDNIVQLRKLRNFTQEALAEKVGVTRQALAKWEAGDTLPDLEGFTPQEQYADDGDGVLPGNSSDDFQPRSMQGNASVDLSDAKNIAAAIRTALHNET